MGIGDIMGAMKQAKELQKILREVEIETGAGGGAVRLRMNGLQEIVELVIEERAVDPDKVEKLEKLITKAVNDAIKDSQKAAATEMRRSGMSMGMPGM